MKIQYASARACIRCIYYVLFNLLTNQNVCAPRVGGLGGYFFGVKNFDGAIFAGVRSQWCGVRSRYVGFGAADVGFGGQFSK